VKTVVSRCDPASFEAWWNAPERQNAIAIFCERFARNSPDGLELWAAEFKRIAAMDKPDL